MRWIVRTHTGKLINLHHPRIDQIDFEDIVYHLSRQHRRGESIGKFYSTAEHCCLVANEIYRNYPGKWDLFIPALFHDAYEAYLGNMDDSYSWRIPDFFGVKEDLQFAVAKRFGFSPFKFTVPEIKHADKMISSVEERCLGSNWKTATPESSSTRIRFRVNPIKSEEFPVECLSPDEAAAKFRELYSTFMALH